MVAIRELSPDRASLAVSSPVTANDTKLLERVFQAVSRGTCRNVALDLSGMEDPSPMFLAKILLLSDFLHPDSWRFSITGYSAPVLSALRHVKAERILRSP